MPKNVYMILHHPKKRPPPGGQQKTDYEKTDLGGKTQHSKFLDY